MLTRKKKQQRKSGNYGSAAIPVDPEVQSQVSYYQNQTSRGLTETVSVIARSMLIISVILIVVVVGMSYFIGIDEMRSIIRGIVEFFQGFWLPIVLVLGLLSVIKLVMGMMGAFGMNMAKTTADAISHHDMIDGQGDQQMMGMVFRLMEKQMESSKSDQQAMMQLLAAAITTSGALTKEQIRSIREAENRAHRAAITGVSSGQKQAAAEARAAARSNNGGQAGYNLEELFAEDEEYYNE